MPLLVLSSETKARMKAVLQRMAVSNQEEEEDFDSGTAEIITRLVFFALAAAKDTFR